MENSSNIVYAVFRSHDSIRVVGPLQEGQGIPPNQRMGSEEFFGFVVNASSPEEAVWKAALTCHFDAFTGLKDVLNLYLEEIGWDRDRPFESEVEIVDEAIAALRYVAQEKVSGCESIEPTIFSEWLPIPSAAENPDQLSLEI